MSNSDWLRSENAVLLRQELGRLCAAIALTDFKAKEIGEVYPHLSDWEEVVRLANAAERFL
jgi:hypothetical protein